MYRVTAKEPIPESKGRGRPRSYPLGALALGESFCVPPDAGHKARLAASARKRNYPGWDYTSRVESDGSVRIWRTA